MIVCGSDTSWRCFRTARSLPANAEAAIRDLSRLSVNGEMARGAERDQVIIGIIPRMAAKLIVVDVANCITCSRFLKFLKSVELIL